MELIDTIKEQVQSNPVILYMKGTPQFPQCGFSAVAAAAVKNCLGSNDKFAAVNVLLQPELRQGLKEYADWPTLPQLYINGELIGGADIIKQLHDSGELQKLLDAAAPADQASQA